MPATIIPLPTPKSLSELETELLGLAGHIAAAECRFLQLLAEFDDREGWAGVGVRSCAHWLSWRAGMSLRTATEHIRVAHALQQLPAVTAAFAEGRLSFSKVRALTRVVGSESATLVRVAKAIADGQPELRHHTVVDPETAEQVLLTLALTGTASHVETVVRALRRHHQLPEDLAARRGLHWRWDTDGSLILTGRLTPDDGAALIAAIEATLPDDPPPSRPDEPVPDDLGHQAIEQDPGPVPDRRAARRADALLELVTHSAEASVVERGRAQVIVHLDAGTGTAHLDNGPEIPSATAERLTCDARIQVLLGDGVNNRMYLGRARRLASPAQIAALTVRDGRRCQFPGCTHTRYLHAHHLTPWSQGGRTDIDNLVLVCSFHHRVVHDHAYRIRRAGQRWKFLRPDGAPVPDVAPMLTGRVERLIEHHTQSRLRIDHRTLTPDWGGEPLDPSPIVATLLPGRRVKAA